FVAVGIVDLDRVVSPPGFLARNRALDELAAKICELVHIQLDEQARFVSARGVLAKNDLAVSAIDLAHRSSAVAFMPTLLEAEHADVKTKRPVHIGNEEDWTRVPASLMLHECSVIRAPDPPNVHVQR